MHRCGAEDRARGIAFNYLFVLGADSHITWLVVGITALYGAIIWTLAYPVYYAITASGLLIRSDWLKYQIPLSTIEMIHPPEIPLSAPAWSLDRLQIDYKKNRKSRIALISPEDKSRFLQELTQRANKLEFKRDQAVRKSES